MGKIKRNYVNMVTKSSAYILIEFSKTKTKVITLANHKGPKAIHYPIKTRGNSTKCGKTCASESRLVLVLLLIG